MIDPKVLGSADDIIADSRATLLESQLARSFKKDNKADQAASVKKYLSLYASVPRDKVHPVLWKASHPDDEDAA